MNPTTKTPGMGPYIRRGLTLTAGAFSDPRVFVVTPVDERLPTIFSPLSLDCMVAQECDGPTYLVIGPYATNGSIDAASKRYGVPVDDLVQFRDALRIEEVDHA